MKKEGGKNNAMVAKENSTTSVQGWEMCRSRGACWLPLFLEVTVHILPF